MSVKIAIVDDLKQDREKLAGYLAEFFSLNNSVEFCVDTYDSAEAFLPPFLSGKYDLVFLDICMDEMNGIQLAKELRVSDAHLLIVFQTTEREYAFDAFPVHPFDYLIKPYGHDEIIEVMNEAVRVLNAGDPVIRVLASRAEYDVPLRSIVALASSGHRTELFLTNKQKLTAAEPFKAINAKLRDDRRFLLINRGIIINMDHVLSPADGNMQMKDGTVFPVKVNGRAAVLSEFSQYMISKVDRKG